MIPYSKKSLRFILYILFLLLPFPLFAQHYIAPVGITESGGARQITQQLELPKTSVSSPYRVANLLVELLEHAGANYIFAVPGGEVLPMVEALHRSSIRYVLTSDERWAAFMADVFGRLKRKPGFCLTTIGPGFTNAITGIADSFLDKSPMIIVAGQVETTTPRGGHQNLNLHGIAEDISKQVVVFGLPDVLQPDQIVQKFHKAMHITMTPPRGPCCLIFPVDVTNALIKPLTTDAKIAGISSMYEPSFNRPVNFDNRINRIARMIAQSKCPAIIVGHGVLRVNHADTLNALKNLIEQCGFPVTMTFMGKGSISSDSLWCLPPMNAFNDYSATYIQERADLVITIGYDIVECGPSIWNPHNDKKIIKINNLKEKDTPYRSHATIIADIKLSLIALAQALRSMNYHTTGLENMVTAIRAKHNTIIEDALKDSHWGNNKREGQWGMNPVRVIGSLRKVIKPHDIIISDVGYHKMLIGRFLPIYEHTTHVNFNGLASMGGGLPGGIGAKLACPDRDVFVVCGDGGFKMSMAEIATAAEYKVPLVVLVFRDNSLGLIKIKQKDQYGDQGVFGVNFGTNINWAHAAESLGGFGYEIENPGEFETELARAIRKSKEHQQPYILVVPVDYDYAHDVFLPHYDNTPLLSNNQIAIQKPSTQIVDVDSSN